jgi:hypothetical protein
MNWRRKKFLRAISDGEWRVRNKLWNGIGVGTVDACINQGLVRTKRIDRKRKGVVESYRIALRITRQGKAELKKEG